MKMALAFFALVASSALLATPSHGVKGHIKKNGTYVAPQRQTNPNKTQRDNYSAKGNVNPYTGKVGTKTPKK